MILLEDIISKDNLTAAFTRLRVDSATGVDGMNPHDLVEWCYKHPYQISSSIINGTHKPLPVKRVLIPKDGGDTRPLGIPCVKDKLVQNAVAIKLEEIYEPEFSDSSFGFRPNRSAHDAVKLIRKYLNEGYTYAIDLDLKSFFDLVNRDVLMNILGEKIKDERVLRLIRRILNVKVLEGKRLNWTDTGLVQGGTISPILANVMLDRLDKELERRGLRFARYADDCIILFRSERAAIRSYESLKRFIENKLRLQINTNKTVIGKVNPGMKFLGFAFVSEEPSIDQDLVHEAGCPRWNVTLHEKSLIKFKKQIRILLNKKAPGGVELARDKYRKYLLGWAHYFYIGLSDSRIKSLMGWIRRKIRALYLKQWKKNATKYREFVELGTNSNERCYIVAHSSQGIWAKALHANYILTNKVIHGKFEWADLKEAVANKSWKELGY